MPVAPLGRRCLPPVGRSCPVQPVVAEASAMIHPETAPSDRGRVWFAALTAGAPPADSGAASVRIADAALDGEMVRYLAVVPDPSNRFPRARQGEVGLLEGWTLARGVREVVGTRHGSSLRPIAAIVDVPS